MTITKVTETVPTQAQIEALKECADDLESMINGFYANTLDYPSQKRKMERDLVTVSRAREVIAALTAAAEVGRTGQEASDNATSSLDWTAAVEVGPYAGMQVNKD